MAQTLLTSALVDIMTDKTFSPVKEPERSIIDKNHLTQVAGIYELKRLGKIKITVFGSIVNMKLNNGMEYRMHLVDKTSFYVPGFDPWISFSSLKDDKFQNIYWNSTVLQTKGKRVSDLTSKP